MALLNGMEIKMSLDLFRRILSQSWPELLEFEKYDTFDNFRIDWLQGNWELTVEQSLLHGSSFLQIYGEGADCNGASSRVLYPEKSATHEIECLPRNGLSLSDLISRELLDYQTTPIYFDQFVRWTNEGWYEEAPDFDCILARYGNEEVVFPFQEATFSLREILK